MMNLGWGAIGGLVAATALIVGGISFVVQRWMELKQCRKDIDGIGKRVTTLEKEAEDRYRALIIALLVPEGKESFLQVLQKWSRG